MPAGQADSAPDSRQFNIIAVAPEKTAGGLLDLSTYAAGLPGVVVALFGLLAAHRLTQRRDRRKEMADLVASLKKLAEDAADAAIKGWLATAGPSRVAAIHETKRKLQSLGIAATTLQLRTEKRRWRLTPPRTGQFGNVQRYPRYELCAINLIKEVSALRRAATIDPFEDEDREPSQDHIRAISRAVGNLAARADRAFALLYD